MNIRKKRLMEGKQREVRCANCFACIKDSEYCYLNQQASEMKEYASKRTRGDKEPAQKNDNA